MRLTILQDSRKLEELLRLPLEERLRLARWLIDSALPDKQMPVGQNGLGNGLLALAGRYAGGPGDTAQRAEGLPQRAAPDIVQKNDVAQVPRSDNR